MVIATALAAAVPYAALLFALLRFGRPWANPAFLVVLYYFLNYPVRALLLIQYPDTFNVEYAFTESEILAGLAYTTAYVAIFGGLYLFFLQRSKVRFDAFTIRKGDTDHAVFTLAAMLVLLSGVTSIGYEISVGGSFALGGDIDALRRPFFVNVMALPYSLKWYVVCMGVLLWILDRRIATGLMTMLVCCVILGEAFLSTGKGSIAAFVLLFLFIDNLVTRRVLRPSAVIVGTLVVVGFSSYSYYARYSGGVGLASLNDYADFFGLFFAEDIQAVVGDRFANIIDRATYYLDAVLLLIRGGEAFGASSGSYALGSLVELANLPPRGLEIFTEQYSFDRHVTFAVWEQLSFAEVFVGRIGESFFVLGWGGLSYAVFYAGLFAFVASRWRLMATDVSGIALYFAILQGWLYQDANLVYQLKNLIGILLCYSLIRGFVVFLFRMRPREFRGQAAA